MKKLFLLSITAAAMMACSSSNDIEPEPDPEGGVVIDMLAQTSTIQLTSEQRAFVDYNTDFSFRLFRTISGMPAGQKSSIVSPISVTYVLGMLNDGAAGQTASEITSVLGFGEGNAKAVNEFCKTMIDEAPKTDPSVTLEIANTIISNEKRDVQLEEQYSQDMSQYYSAQLSSFDFSKSAEAVGKINAWCKDKTHGMIPEILKESELSPDALLVLMNAIYFKATWTEKFDSKDTRNETFTTASGQQQQLLMMHRKARIMSAQNDVYTSIELPYGSGTRWSMTVMLPNDGKTIDDIIQSLNSDTWRQVQRSSRTVIADIKIPRFTTKFETDLVEPLKAMGAPSMFDGSVAEFPNISTNYKHELYVALMKQKAAIEVDEEGTKASAVTIAEVKDESAGPSPEPKKIDFHCDRPFVYVIQEYSSGVVFFVGTFRG